MAGIVWNANAACIAYSVLKWKLKSCPLLWHFYPVLNRSKHDPFLSIYLFIGLSFAVFFVLLTFNWGMGKLRIAIATVEFDDLLLFCRFLNLIHSLIILYFFLERLEWGKEGEGGGGQVVMMCGGVCYMIIG